MKTSHDSDALQSECMDRLPAHLPLTGPPEPAADLPSGDLMGRLVAQAEASFRAARTVATLRAYEHDWKRFRDWCERNRLISLPASPQAIILYSTDLVKNKRQSLNTLSRRLAAVSQMHQQAGFDSPTRAWAVKQFLHGLRREVGAAPSRKRPVLVADLHKILSALPNSLLGVRDRALLLLGFTGGLRRSELVGLNIDDLEESSEGLIVTIRRSKTDQEGQGRRVGIPPGVEQTTCPIRALEQWRAAADVNAGPLFRVMNRHSHVLEKRLSAEAVSIIVKRYVEKLGYDPMRFGGHSLRAGLATSAAAAGKSERAIMNQTGHKSVTTVRRYIRDGSLFRDNAAEGLGL